MVATRLAMTFSEALEQSKKGRTIIRPFFVANDCRALGHRRDPIRFICDAIRDSMVAATPPQIPCGISESTQSSHGEHLLDAYPQTASIVVGAV